MLPFHVYEMDLGKVNLDVVWVENDNGNGYLLSADNLCYIARQLLGYERRSSVDPMEAANRIKEYLLENFTCGKKEVIIYSPETRQGQKKKNLFKNIFVKCVFLEEKRYSPIIPVLQAPNSFMVIVPAANSLKAIDIIKKKYELEMGKVRDRLPINLGVIYAGSKMPVRSLLEAGKVILSKPLLSPEVWKVENSNFENNNLLVLNLEKQDRSLSGKFLSK